MQNLVELHNRVEIIGVLKSKNLELKESAKGIAYITGYLIISANIDNVIHDFKVNVFTMNTRRSEKTFEGTFSILNEYKSIESHGENADTVKVLGSLKLNSYKMNNKIIEFNEIKGNFYFKVSKKIEHSAYLVVETIIEHIRSNNGRLEVNGFNVAYNEEIINLKNMYVQSEQKEIFKELFSKKNLTTCLTCRLECPVQVEKSVHGFGIEIHLSNLKESFNNLDLCIVGGSSKAYNYLENEQSRQKIYTLEMINIAKDKLKKEQESM